MEVEVVNPTSDEYMTRVRVLATKYIGDADKWFKLTPSDVTEEDDRDEFSFIRMALWDVLMEREFFPTVSPPGQGHLFNQCVTPEPGSFPGSSLLGGEIWALISMPRLSGVC